MDHRFSKTLVRKHSTHSNDANLYQVEKEFESTFLPDADLQQVEMIGI
jgi:hypothetical protein